MGEYCMAPWPLVYGGFQGPFFSHKLFNYDIMGEVIWGFRAQCHQYEDNT